MVNDFYGAQSSFFTFENGTVKSCGLNTSGELGLGNNNPCNKFTLIPKLSGVKRVSQVIWTSFFLLEDGTVKACGFNGQGQLGLGDSVDRNVPTLIPNLTGVKQIETLISYATYFLLADGTVKVCGLNNNGELGFGDKVGYIYPKLIPNLRGVKEIFSNSSAVYFLLDDGTVKTCGNNEFGQLGLGDKKERLVPTLIPNLIGVKQISATTAYLSVCFLLTDGTVKACGRNDNGQLGLGDNTSSHNTPTLIPGLTGVKEVQRSRASFYFLLADGTVKACGENGHGQLGLGDTVNRNIPTLISGLTGVKQVEAERAGVSVYFLLEDGTSKACGNNEFGQLGLSDKVNRNVPTLIPNLTGVKQISTNLNFAVYFLLEDGAVKTCGYNYVGQLGLGDAVNRHIPTLIPDLTEEFIISKKYLYLKNTEVYAEQNNVLAKVADNYQVLTNDQKKALFVAASSAISAGDKLSALGKFKILRYSTENNQAPYTATAIPHKSRIIPKELITLNTSGGIRKVSLNAQGACKVFVTTNLDSYKSFDFTERVWLDSVIGINETDLPCISQIEWDALLQGGKQIAFAYELDIESTSDTAQFADLLITLYDSGGASWDMAVPGTDYTYGYPANNLLRVSIKTNGDYKINYPG